MKNNFRIYIKGFFWLWLFTANVCVTTPQGVFSEISGLVAGEGVSVQSTDSNLYFPITNNSITLTLAEAQNAINNHGGLILSGYYIIDIVNQDSAGCYLFVNNWVYYIVFLLRDNVDISSQINLNSNAVTPNDVDFSFNITFDDPSINTPENHTYTLEFWECTGYCSLTDYDLATEKKAQLDFYVSLVP